MSSDPKKLLGIAIRTRRQELGWTQEKLADTCGLHWTYVGGIERGERNVSLMNIVAIARALGASIAELTKGIK